MTKSKKRTVKKQTAEKKKLPPLVQMEDYGGYWSVRTSPLYAPKPLLNKEGKPIKSWASERELEFICSDQTGLAYLANCGVMEPVEKYVRKVGGTHYVAYPSSVGGYLQVFRLK